MAVREILQLGNPDLYKVSEPLLPEEIAGITPLVDDLHDTMMDFRHRSGKGRAIAAPQIGVFKRVIYMHTGKPVVFINPLLFFPDVEMMEVWDDCMSFPTLLVKVERFRRVRVEYTDLAGRNQSELFEDDLAELMQHEYDHLDGILAVSRAIDGQSFSYLDVFNQQGETSA